MNVTPISDLRHREICFAERTVEDMEHEISMQATHGTGPDFLLYHYNDIAWIVALQN